MPWKNTERFGQIAERCMQLFFRGDAVWQAMPLRGAGENLDQAGAERQLVFRRLRVGADPVLDALLFFGFVVVV